MQYISKRTIISLTLAIIAVALLCVFKFAYASSSPLVETGDFSLNQDKAILMGTIVDSGGQDISQYGFLWGTSPDLQNAETFIVPADAEGFGMEISSLAEGTTYYYQAFAENSKGSGFGEIRSLVVPENHAPTVEITSPADGLKVVQGETVAFAITASDDQEVAGIILEIDGLVYQEVKKPNLDYQWDTSEVKPGTYEIKVTASDGQKNTEKAVRLEVKTRPVEQARETSRDTSKEIAKVNTGVTPSPVNNTGSVSRGTTSTSAPPGNNSYPKLSKTNGYFGQFRYRDTYGGRIEIDPQWVKENIVTITLPGLNKQVQVHKDAAGAFIKAFTYIENGTAVINGQTVPLISLIKTMDGTWVPRHIGWNINRNLSNHSWGTAIDINASDHYRYVDPAKEPYDPNLILWEKAFKPAGFSWGNSYADAMHYELLW